MGWLRTHVPYPLFRKISWKKKGFYFTAPKRMKTEVLYTFCQMHSNGCKNSAPYYQYFVNSIIEKELCHSNPCYLTLYVLPSQQQALPCIQISSLNNCGHVQTKPQICEICFLTLISRASLTEV